MKKQEVSIFEVAKLAGVSIATVSRVINGNVNVSKEKRKSVEEAIKELNYIPNEAARNLSIKEKRSVIIVVNKNIDVFTTKVMQGVIDGLELVDKTPVIFTSESLSSSGISEKVNKMKAYHPAAIVYLDTINFDLYNELNAEADSPIISIDGTSVLQNHFLVTVDYQEVFTKLKNQLGTNIGYVSNSKSPISRDRFEAFKKYTNADARHYSIDEELNIEDFKGYEYVLCTRFEAYQKLYLEFIQVKENVDKLVPLFKAYIDEYMPKYHIDISPYMIGSFAAAIVQKKTSNVENLSFENLINGEIKER